MYIERGGERKREIAYIYIYENKYIRIKHKNPKIEYGKEIDVK